MTLNGRNGLLSDVLFLALAAAVTAALAPAVPLPDGVRLVLALPAVLLIPGGALSLALWPGGGLGAPARLLLSLGLSLATGALGGLLLNYTAPGLQAQSWAALLLAVVLGAGSVAVARRHLLPGAPPGSDASNAPPPRAPALRPAIDGGAGWLPPGLLFGLAFLVLVGAWSVARGGETGAPGAGATQLWMLPAAGTGGASGGGGAAGTGGSTGGGGADASSVRIGVRSEERGAARFRLRLELDGAVLKEWPALELRPGEEWEERTPLPAAGEGSGPLTAALFRAEAPETPYRRVLLWPRQGQG